MTSFQTMAAMHHLKGGNLFEAAAGDSAILQEKPPDEIKKYLEHHQACIDTLGRLDAANDFMGVHAYLTGQPHVLPGLPKAVRHFLARRRLHTAFIIAALLGDTEPQDPYVSFAMAVGGLITGQAHLASMGLSRLDAQADRVDAHDRSNLHRIIGIVVSHLILDVFHRDTGMTLKVLEIFKTAIPRFRQVFDEQAAIPVMRWPELVQRDREQARLIHHLLPPAHTPRPVRRAVIAIHLSYVALRVSAAMNAYGWQTVLCDRLDQDLAQKARHMVETCRQCDADLLVFDDHLFVYEAIMNGQSAVRDQMIRQLKQEKPSLKVVGCHSDLWIYKPEVLEAFMSALDVLWPCGEPTLPCLKNPAFANKILYMPFPMGIHDLPAKPLVPRMQCHANVSTYNYPRAFWLAAAEHLGLPIDQKPSSTMVWPEHLTPLENYEHYLQVLADATCCLTFTMRQTLTPVATAQVFEIMMMGSLLVTEVTPDLHHFFIPGEHYLEFSSLAELSGMARFIAAHPDQAEEIRRCGHAFARERYSDEKIIGALDHLLDAVPGSHGC